MIEQVIEKIAATSGPHISLKAEKVFTVFGVEITNSILYGAVVAIVISALGFYIGRQSKVKPIGGITQIFEFLIEQLLDMLEGVFKSRKKAVKYAPIFGTFFIFIILSNLSGLVPLVGEGVKINGTLAFRPFTADFNGTLAMSIVAVLIVQYLSIKEQGVKGHLQHFFSDKPYNPINFFVGVTEVLGEFIKMASLSLRLFLNTAIGEILIAVMAYVGKNGATITLLPIVAFEVLVALIQAYVFTILCANYLALAIAHSSEHGHDSEDHEQHDDATSSDNLSPAQA